MSQDKDDICQFCGKETATCFTLIGAWSETRFHVCQPCADKGGYRVYDSPTPLKRQGKQRLLEETGETR